MTQFKFSAKSKARLRTCKPEIREVFETVLALGIIDFGVSCGVRTKEEQNKAYSEGRSKLKWPKSKHNVINLDRLSNAVDVYIYIKGKGISYHQGHCCILAGLVLGEAARRGIKMRWGGNWDMDSEPLTDQRFQDLVHFELI